MTREEAIEILTDMKRIRSTKISEACDMAISALSAEPNVTNVPTDLISRADAKKQIIEKVFHDYTDEMLGTMQVLDELPSVSAERVVRCKDCEYAEHRSQMPNQVYCHRDTLSLSCSVHDDDDYCKWAKMKGGAE